MTGYCESCDGLMSDTGLFPIDDSHSWAFSMYQRRGRNFIVPKIDHENPVGPICNNCSNAVKQWEKESLTTLERKETEMITYNIMPRVIGEPFTKSDLDELIKISPSLQKIDVFRDGSINVEVFDRESDDLTDYLDSVQLSYTLL